MTAQADTHTPLLEPGDCLINSATARELAGISDMTLWRWVKAGVIHKPIQIRRRNYWSRTRYLRDLAMAGQVETA